MIKYPQVDRAQILGKEYVVFLRSRNNKQRKSTFAQILINILKAATLLLIVITSLNFEKQ